jgi:hypothetical protein
VEEEKEGEREKRWEGEGEEKDPPATSRRPSRHYSRPRHRLLPSSTEKVYVLDL